jgi:hypothetical protein
MLLDAHGRVVNLDLLDNPGDMRVLPQWAGTAGADVEGMYDRVGDLLGRKGRAVVFGMSGLSADGSGSRAEGRRACGLDDIGGGRLGRCGGILACGGELLPELRDLTAQGSALRLQGVPLCSQTLAVGTAR